MAKRFYVDTAIWRDYWEDRSDRFQKLGEIAEKFFERAIAEGWIIIYSDIVVAELLNCFTYEELMEIFSIVNTILCRVEGTEKQAKEAQRISDTRNIPPGDAMHAILAKAHNAVVVTRDKHFTRLRDIAEWKRPEELL